MGNVDQHVARQYLWFDQRLGNAVDGPYRYATANRYALPLISEPTEMTRQGWQRSPRSCWLGQRCCRETRIFRQL